LIYLSAVATIFLVEDNEAISEAVAGYLELAEHSVRLFDSGAGVVEAVQRDEPDLIILDVMLPGENGFAIAKRVRKVRATPFLFLTARESESDRILGFELGAEDYVVKPFSPRELVLRVEAILRRLSISAESEGDQTNAVTLTDGTRTLELREEHHKVLLDGTSIELTASEWRILSYLAHRPKILISREQLLTEGLDYLHDGSERTVDTHIKNIRAKLGSQWIETVRGFGYRCSVEAVR
jgi:two-component system phosphate regulon response regulator PhoB